ncbi:hypothetical protein PSUB009319_02490 [Ralstonia sp. SET104]|nr:hypothetical protein PSUB009319_02490 [Ralstonia sp. SET104]
MKQHPEGYVLNTTRSDSQYAMLHASGCHHISTYASNYADNAFTGDKYIKVCSDNSSDEERLDPCNGLPLIATLDRLFDQYLITFDPKTGGMQVSHEIGKADRAILGLPANLRKVPNQGQAGYLRLHLDHFETKSRT